MHGLPLEDFHPSSFIVPVVDCDDVLHVRLLHVPLLPLPTLHMHTLTKCTHTHMYAPDLEKVDH